MPISQQDFTKSRTSNTYFSYVDQQLGSKFHSRGSSVEEPSCDHWQFCEKVPNRSDVEADSLGSPVGLVCSNTPVNNPCGSPPEQQEANVLNFATYLKAFALIYVLPEVDWTAEKIDMLLEEGSELFRASSEMDQQQQEDNPEGSKLFQPEIYTNEEKRIKRNFNLEGHTFTLALEPRYLGAGSKPLDQQPSHTIQNLKTILVDFFKSSRYCLLLTRVGHLLVWRRKRVFFVLDVKGRRRDDLQMVENKGVAMLVCLKTIDNVVHLVSNLSGTSPADEFTIRELVVVRLETPDGRIYMRDTSHRSIEFKVVNKSYAYLKGTLHLSLNENDPVRNRSSLMVAVASILASKIDHPANWDTNMLDRLICYGVELCRSCWSDCLRDRRPIDLDTFPTQLRLGQFVLELKLLPMVRTGHWRCGVRILHTDFEAHVSQALREYANLVFQINNQMYAMWTKDEFYYLLDPYRHTIVGTHVAEDGAGKWATVRMFRDQLTMLSVFHQLLMESNRQSAYYLHVLRIRNLAECPEGYALAPLPADVDNCDVQSLNEPIFFNEQRGVRVCDRSLAEISDYEEDVVSLMDDKNDIEKLQILDERHNAGAEGEMCEEEMETNPLKKHNKSAKGSKSKRCECRITPCRNTCFQGSTKSRTSILKKEQVERKKLLSPEIKKGTFVRFSRQTGGGAKSPERSRSREALSPGRIIRKHTKITRQTGGRSSPRSCSKSPKRSGSKDEPSTGRITIKSFPMEALSKGLGQKVGITQGSTARETGGGTTKSPLGSKSKRVSSALRNTHKSSPKEVVEVSVVKETAGRSFNHTPTKSPVLSKFRRGSSPGRSSPKEAPPRSMPIETSGRSPSPSSTSSPFRSKSRHGSSPHKTMKRSIKNSRETAGRSSSPTPLKSPERSRSIKKFVKTTSTKGSSPDRTTIKGSPKESSFRRVVSKVVNAEERTFPDTATKIIGDGVSKSSNPKPMTSNGSNHEVEASTSAEGELLMKETPTKRSELKTSTSAEGEMPLKEALSKRSELKESTTRILARKDILQQSGDMSKSLGVAPVASAHLITPTASGFTPELDHIENSSLPAMEFLNIEELNEDPAKGAESPTEKGESRVSSLRFPGFNRVPQLLAVAGSESGTVESLNRLLGSAFKVANRVLTMTPWGNYVVFRHHPTHGADSVATWFYVFDGCTCDIDRFRHLDLTTGTAGLIAFRKQSEVVCHIIDSRKEKALKNVSMPLEDSPHKRLQKLLAR
ncbi:uncharacterized protein LOC108145981 [Drosophila elegans]|uniref:uncharacterized protein LOC108145981 n=1 Tax=Drosophila elegans TaxID=30023 RepID=UPI0007E87958|nr:uncharacterized protein LOC108145981 [Drosophila elegans]